MYTQRHEKNEAGYDAVVAAPFACLGLTLVNSRLATIEFLPRQTPLHESIHPVVRQFQAQLEAYCRDPKAGFDLPTITAGTPFQKRVWQGIRDIPAGRTASYSELAGRVKSGARAVANACRNNPLPLITPCHRIVSVAGLGGFAGSQVGYLPEIKQWLLDHEATGNEV